MQKIFYMPIESYESRYSLQLTGWNQSVFEKRNIEYEIVYGVDISSNKIVTGSVLDAHGRSYYSLTQTAALVKLMQEGKVTEDSAILYEDMFTPGMESLAYILDQVPSKYKPKIYVRCLAQTIDPDDFVNREGMFDWMRKYEHMVDKFVDGILVASEEMVSHLRIAGFTAPIYVTGLPFGKQEVAGRVANVKPVEQRTKRVAFAARWDSEKQPEFYMDLAREFYKINPNVEFAVFTGRPELTSNNPEYVTQAIELQNSKHANFKIYSGLKKNDYYSLLSDSVVLFNCALQDWVSNTVSEADTFGTLTLYPAYRSFPEVFANNKDNMYIPWSLDDAIEKLEKMINTPEQFSTGKVSDWQNGTIDRTIDVLQGNGTQWARNTLDYRKYVSQPKYR